MNDEPGMNLTIRIVTIVLGAAITDTTLGDAGTIVGGSKPFRGSKASRKNSLTD